MAMADSSNADPKGNDAAANEAGEASLSARELAQAAMSAMADLTRYEPESVSGMEWDGESWHVAVDVLELARVPNTTDVLATYDVRLDDEGTLLSYTRARRFQRAQVEGD
jgi:gas vesicle protein GvpO